MDKSENWRILELNRGVMSCENVILTKDDLMDILNLVEKQFDVEHKTHSAAAIDEVCIGLKINGHDVTAGWDIWSGVFIMSNDVSGNDTIKQIYNLLTANI